MAIAVTRPYACPICQECFTKWGICQTHTRTSAPCRNALGEMLQDMEKLQEACRNAAKAQGNSTTTTLSNTCDNSAAATLSGSLQSSVTVPIAGSTNTTLVAGDTLDSAAPAPSQDTKSHSSSTLPAPESQPKKLAYKALRLLEKACRERRITDADRADIDSKLSELVEHPEAVQVATIGKFLSCGVKDLRRITDKGAWMERCLKFCVRRAPSAGKANEVPTNPSPLLTALTDQALLPDVLPQEHWDHFLVLAPDIQQCVVNAVRSSLLANIVGKISEHFEHLCYNERAIYIQEQHRDPIEIVEAPQVEWDALDGRPYQKLVQHMTLKQNVEERVLIELGAIDASIPPGAPGSLIYDHARTTDTRRQGSADVGSLLHAAAHRGLVRVCARFISEGFDVNERTGYTDETPLHLAAAVGELEVVNLLLNKYADPNLRNGDGHTPLYVAIQAFVKDGEPQAHRSLRLKTCNMLLYADAQCVPEGGLYDAAEPAKSPQTLAQENGLHDFDNLIRLHLRIKALREKFTTLDAAIINEILKLQYETASFVLGIMEQHTVTVDAVPTEFRALIASEFVQSRDKIQMLGNQLYRRFPSLRKKAICKLTDLHPEAATLALRSFKVEEIVPRVYEVPDYLNNEVAVEAPAETNTNDVVESNENDGVVGTDAIVEEQGEKPRIEAEEPKLPHLRGKVRKWDTERGFGFIVQDPEADAPGKDVFVHRQNIVGSRPDSHINLKEQARVCFKIGEREGRPRALEVMMLGEDGLPSPVHGVKAVGSREGGDYFEFADDSDPDDDSDEEELTRKFIRHLKNPDIQKLAKEKRTEVESWLRCVGLKRHHSGRRDDAMWRREIERRIDMFLARSTTPMQKKDFDYRVRRFLYEICLHSSVASVSEALAACEAATVEKTRDEVRSWPAYLLTLLKKFDPKLYESLSERDKRSRSDMRDIRRARDGDDDVSSRRASVTGTHDGDSDRLQCSMIREDSPTGSIGKHSGSTASSPREGASRSPGEHQEDPNCSAAPNGDAGDASQCAGDQPATSNEAAPPPVVPVRIFQ